MKRKIGAFLVVLAILAALGGAVYYFFFYMQLPDEATFKEEYQLVLQDYTGEDVRLSDFKRKVLVVFTWASWCPYCSAELQNLAQLKDTYGDDIQIIAVNRNEPLVEAKRYTDALSLPSSVALLLDPNDALYKDIGGYAMPETVFITPTGKVLYHQHGPMTLQAANEKVQELLQSL